MAKDINNLRVAMVVNNHQLVLNAGSVDGVAVGYSYVIYEMGPQIEDPVNGDDLGSLEIVKGRVWVHNVAEAHCLAGDNPDAKVSQSNSRSVQLKIFGLETATPLGNVYVGDHAKRVA